MSLREWNQAWQLLGGQLNDYLQCEFSTLDHPLNVRPVQRRLPQRRHQLNQFNPVAIVTAEKPYLSFKATQGMVVRTTFGMHSPFFLCFHVLRAARAHILICPTS